MYTPEAAGNQRQFLGQMARGWGGQGDRVFSDRGFEATPSLADGTLATRKRPSNGGYASLCTPNGIHQNGCLVFRSTGAYLLGKHVNNARSVDQVGDAVAPGIERRGIARILGHGFDQRIGHRHSFLRFGEPLLLFR